MNRQQPEENPNARVVRRLDVDLSAQIQNRPQLRQTAPVATEPAPLVNGPAATPRSRNVSIDPELAAKLARRRAVTKDEDVEEHSDTEFDVVEQVAPTRQRRPSSTRKSTSPSDSDEPQPQRSLATERSRIANQMFGDGLNVFDDILVRTGPSRDVTPSPRATVQPTTGVVSAPIAPAVIEESKEIHRRKSRNLFQAISGRAPQAAEVVVPEVVAPVVVPPVAAPQVEQTVIAPQATEQRVVAPQRMAQRNIHEAELAAEVARRQREARRGLTETLALEEARPQQEAQVAVEEARRQQEAQDAEMARRLQQEMDADYQAEIANINAQRQRQAADAAENLRQREAAIAAENLRQREAAIAAENLRQRELALARVRAEQEQEVARVRAAEQQAAEQERLRQVARGVELAAQVRAQVLPRIEDASMQAGFNAHLDQRAIDIGNHIVAFVQNGGDVVDVNAAMQRALTNVFADQNRNDNSIKNFFMQRFQATDNEAANGFLQGLVQNVIGKAVAREELRNLSQEANDLFANLARAPRI